MFELQLLKGKNVSKFAQILLFEPKLDHLLPYENKSKSLGRATGQDFNLPYVSEVTTMVTFCI